MLSFSRFETALSKSNSLSLLPCLLHKNISSCQWENKDNSTLFQNTLYFHANFHQISISRPTTALHSPLTQKPSSWTSWTSWTNSNLILSLPVHLLPIVAFLRFSLLFGVLHLQPLSAARTFQLQASSEFPSQYKSDCSFKLN